MGPMKGSGRSQGWMLILIAVCLVPAVSAAQDTETATTPEPAANPPEPAANPRTARPPSRGSRRRARGDTCRRRAGRAADPGRARADAATGPAPRRVSGKARASASASVSIGDNFYSPASVSIGVGDTVTWANNGQAQHSATADNGSFDTGVPRSRCPPL